MQTCTGAKRAAGLADVWSPDQKKMVRISLQQSVTAHISMSPGEVRCISITPGQSEQRGSEGCLADNEASYFHNENS